MIKKHICCFIVMTEERSNDIGLHGVVLYGSQCDRLIEIERP